MVFTLEYDISRFAYAKKTIRVPREFTRTTLCFSAEIIITFCAVGDDNDNEKRIRNGSTA